MENNDFNEEVNVLAKNYYDSLDNNGCNRIIHKQKGDENGYYADSSCLTYLKKKLEILSCLNILKILIWLMLIMSYHIIYVKNK